MTYEYDPAPGYVYLIISSNGLVKIGKSKSPEDRLNKLQTGSSTKLVLLAKIETSDPDSLEKELHERFQDQRVQGEWFRLSEADIGMIFLIARDVELWITKLNQERLFTEAEVNAIIRRRVDQLNAKYRKLLDAM